MTTLTRRTTDRTDPAAPALVQVRGLRKRYGPRWVLDGLDLDVAPGEIVALLGVNGAGKTTALEILCGLRRPTEGSVRVAGADPTADPRAVRTAVGTVLQAPALDGVETPREVLELQARLRGAGARAAAAVADAALARADLTDLADRRIAALSGGQRRRVDLATATIGDPRLLVLDEPTTGLDPASRRLLWSEVRTLAAGGVGVLLSTQDLQEAEELAHRLVVLRDGRVVADTTADRLRAAAGVRSLVVRLADDSEVRRPLPVNAPVPLDDLAALAAAGTEVADIRVEAPSLDDAVIALTA